MKLSRSHFWREHWTLSRNTMSEKKMLMYVLDNDILFCFLLMYFYSPIVIWDELSTVELLDLLMS